MLVALGDSLSDLASSDNGEDKEEEDDEETEHGQLSDDDKPGWRMGTIGKVVQQQMERFRPKLMKLDELTHPGWVDAADYYRERDKKYGTSLMRVPAVVKLQTANDAAAPAPTTFRELMECLDIVSGISQMPPVTSFPGRSHRMLGSGNLQPNTSILSLAPTGEPDWSLNLNAKPFELESFYPCIWPPEQITL